MVVLICPMVNTRSGHQVTTLPNDLNISSRDQLARATSVLASLSKNGGHVCSSVAGIRTHGSVPPSHVHQGPDPGKTQPVLAKVAFLKRSSRTLLGSNRLRKTRSEGTIGLFGHLLAIYWQGSAVLAASLRCRSELDRYVKSPPTNGARRLLLRLLVS